MTKLLKPHPAAALFPMLPDAEIDAIAADLKARGQMYKGVTLDGLLLDGRNRQEACRRAGLPFATETWQEVVARATDPVRASMSPTEWVLATNLHRRHLNETQRAVIAEEALPLLEAEARQRQKATLKRGAAPVSAPGRGRGGDTVNKWVAEGGGTYRVTGESGSRYKVFFYRGKYAIEHQAADGSIANTKERLESVDVAKALAAKWEKEQLAALEKAAKKPKGKAAELAAKAVGASARSVERAKAVLKKKPELREQLKAAKLTLKQAEKQIKKEEQLKNVLEYRPPVGKYAVIVADPSWKFDDELDGSDQARGGVGYPPQTEEEICAMQVGKNFAAPDCALWLWVTGTHLMNGAAARVLEAWGFIPKCCYTWCKVDKAGNDRLGTGRYGRNVTEFVILAIRGKPVVDAADQPNKFDAPRSSRHSQKPDRAFEIFEKVTPCDPTARLELHAVEERKGWVTSGSEQQAKAREARGHIPDAPAIDTTPVDRLLDAGWEPIPNGWAKVIAGVHWVVDHTGGHRRTPFAAYRPANNDTGTPIKRLGDFETIEEAVAAIERAASREKPAERGPVIDDGTLCGIRPSKNGDGCIHKQGHDGVHSNGKTTWRTRKKLIDARGEAGA